MKYSSAKTDNSGEKPLLQRPVFTIILISVMKSFSKTYNTCHAFLPPSPSPLHCPVPLSSCRCTACLPRWFVSSCCHLQQRPPSLSGCCDKPQSHAYKPLLSEKAVKTTMAKRNDTIQVFPSWTTIFVIHN